MRRREFLIGISRAVAARREFTMLIAGVGAAWLRGAFAQSIGRVPRIAFLGNASPSTVDPRQVAAFKQGLRENGLIEGSNVEVEYFWIEGSLDRMRTLVANLGQGNFDVILTAGSKVVLALLATGTEIPIVFAVIADPVGSGTVKGLARPGGNATGLSMSDSDLESKRVELLKEAVPSIRNVMILRDPIVGAPTGAAEAQATAQALGLGVIVAEASSPDELEATFKRAREQGADAIATMASAFFNFNRKRLIELAAQYRLPSIWETDVYVKDGGLMSYGPNFPDMYRRSAEYVARILKGAKPSDLPVQQPTKFELAVNLQAANKLGVTIPPTVIARADEVIE
jgi:putative ABC transport system substrate-binding protein